MPEAKIGVIGGSGLYDIEGMEDVQEVNIDTPFGRPSDVITVGRLGGVGIAFLPRHGKGHRISPSELNARANIYAMKSLGVEQIIAVCSAGRSQPGRSRYARAVKRRQLPPPCS